MSRDSASATDTGTDTGAVGALPDEPEQSTPPTSAVDDAPPANEAPSKPKRGGGGPGPGPRDKYGYRKMRRALSVPTTKRLDGRSAVAVGVRMLKDDIRRDRGGDLSRAEEVILESAARAWVILSSLDDYIARQSTLVNARKKTVLPVIHTRMQVAEGLARNLDRLGLHRVEREVSLEDYLEQRAAEKAEEPKPSS